MSIAALIRRMSSAGASPEAIAIAVEAIEAEQQKQTASRAKAAERKARQRAKERDSHATVTGQERDTVSPKKETSPTPPKEKTTPSTISEANASSISLETEFEQQFWPAYPRRVGKGQALKAFRSARKQADLETILTGVRRYAADRQGENPEYTKHASTWLNGQRWLDEPVPKRHDPPPKQSAPANPRQQMWIDEFNKHSGQSHEPVSEEGSVLDLSHGDGYSCSDGGPVRLAYSRLG